ncbi:MAG: hypothetical protein ACLQIB_17785, partial [Isosphaeraceae bacterium]
RRLGLGLGRGSGRGQEVLETNSMLYRQEVSDDTSLSWVPVGVLAIETRVWQWQAGHSHTW